MSHSNLAMLRAFPLNEAVSGLAMSSATVSGCPTARNQVVIRELYVIVNTYRMLALCQAPL